MSKLSNCKVCKAEIATSAKTCPQCGAKNKKPFYKKWWLWGIVIIAIIIAANLGGNTDNSVPTGADTTQKLTLEKYNKIENGMTYEDVIKIIGFEISPEVETGEKGTDLYTVSYRYMGNDQVTGTLGANASFMFQGGKLNTKAQLGLK
ncbi:MAG: hypothetical protein ACYDG2_01310 [Ruminiclostridium sp.]